MREFGELGDCDPRVDALELALNPESEAELADKSNVVSAKNVEIFRDFRPAHAEQAPPLYFPVPAHACSVETVGSLLADLDTLATRGAKSGMDCVRALIGQRGLRSVNYDGWLKLNAAEVERGKPKGKPREKFTRLHEMLALVE